MIKHHTHNGVAHIQIARLEKKNAITTAMYQTMADAINNAVADDAVRSILLYGEPAIFTAGNDLEDFAKSKPAANIEESLKTPVFQFMRALHTCDKPVVVAVTGAAVGIGTTLLMHVDLVYLADNAKLTMPFVKLGLCAEFASSLLIPQTAGWARAAEGLLLGEAILPADAVSMGIATRVLPAADVLAYATAKAEAFNLIPADGVRTTKRLMRKALHGEVLPVIANEGAEFGRLLQTPAAQAAFAAFLGKK